MKSQFTLAAFLLVSIVLLQACTTSDRPEELAFLSRQTDAQWRIYTMNVDGSGATQLRSGLIEDGCPVWSHSGRQIMFVSSNGKGFEDRERNIYLLNLENSNVTQITHGDSGIVNASWSPDDLRILYAAGPGVYPIHIYLMNTDGSDVIQITHHFAQDRLPVISSEGTAILFSANPTEIHGENPNYDIYVTGLDGASITRLTDGPEFDYTFNPPVDLGAKWSPDTHRIVYYSKRSNTESKVGANIFVMNSDGSNKIQITDSSAPIQNISPTWSPDGHRIAFASNRDHPDSPSTFDIYVINADGSNLHRRTYSGNNLCPDWRQ